MDGGSSKMMGFRLVMSRLARVADAQGNNNGVLSSAEIHRAKGLTAAEKALLHRASDDVAKSKGNRDIRSMDEAFGWHLDTFKDADADGNKRISRAELEAATGFGDRPLLRKMGGVMSELRQIKHSIKGGHRYYLD